MNIHDFAESKRLDLRQVMDFTSGANPLGPSNRAKYAIRKGIKYLSFPPDKSISHLKRYICKKEVLGEENIVFGPGLPEMMRIVMEAFRPASTGLLSPLSGEYDEAFNRINTTIITHPLQEAQGFSADMEKLIQEMTGIDLLVLKNPHDITGSVLSIENLARIIDETGRRGKILVIDEAYLEFTQAISPVRQVIESGGAVILRTFSVFYGLAGLPLAYAIGPGKLINKIHSVCGPLQIGSLAYMAALASLKDKGYRKRTLSFIKEEKQFIGGRLKAEARLDVIDTPCNFLLLKMRLPMPDLKERMRRRNILIDVYTDETGGLFIRFPIKTHKFNARFIKTLKMIIEEPGEVI